jgi:hypothetical protein
VIQVTDIYVPADRDVTITNHGNGAVTISGLLASDMPVAEPEAVGSIVTFTHDGYNLKVCVMKTDRGWYGYDTDGDEFGADWADIVNRAREGTIRTFPAPRG